MRRFTALTGILALSALAGTACVDGEVEDGETDAFPDGKADGGIDEGSPEAIGVLALVNDPAMTAAKLKAEAGITTRVSNNIVKHRNGADGQSGTGDDNKFDTLRELDGVSYVGPTTLSALLEAARDRGLVQSGAKIDVVFSPQASPDGHTARIAQMIRGATKSVDIAIYSYSDAGIAAALADAVSRGVKVRFLFETANADRKIVDAAARAASKSGKIEAQGIDVRYVNKILHHKFLIIDGPRDDASRAKTAKVVTGSGNWSSSAVTQFDENTMFIQDSAEIAASFQQEFDKLWNGSRDFVGPAPAQARSTANITVDSVPDEPGLGVLFTSPNFKLGGADMTTWSVNKESTVVSDVWVDAIERAQTSIHIASGHLRLRPVAEALIAKKRAKPSFDIQVYLDQQEFISKSGHDAQVAEMEECLERATTPAQERDCQENDFLFSRALVDAGIDVKFKSFAYRWDHSYAPQMHSKYMVVDGKELISGSYNLSMNAEHASFENALHVSGAQHAGLVSAFEQNFTKIVKTGRAENLLAGLRSQISSGSNIPLVFPSMALTYAEFESLRALIRQNCRVVDSAEYRANPGAHRTCPR
ncbi:MAG: phospholipase D-like domain-containing protein [Kofleriaceae bacterium]|nr:phospholipase D-like domain-containing protein [Kofleriaceae bacterium]